MSVPYKADKRKVGDETATVARTPRAAKEVVMKAMKAMKAAKAKAKGAPKPERATSSKARRDHAQPLQAKMAPAIFLASGGASF